jgi:hypothetical protein
MERRIVRYSEEKTNPTTLYIYSFGHLSSRAGVIFCCLLFLVPRAAKSKIAGLRQGWLILFFLCGYSCQYVLVQERYPGAWPLGSL